MVFCVHLLHLNVKALKASWERERGRARGRLQGIIAFKSKQVSYILLCPPSPSSLFSLTEHRGGCGVVRGRDVCVHDVGPVFWAARDPPCRPEASWALFIHPFLISAYGPKPSACWRFHFFWNKGGRKMHSVASERIKSFVNIYKENIAFRKEI